MALSRFLFKSGEKCSHFFKILRANRKFEWGEECEKEFLMLKETLSLPPLLKSPFSDEELFLYLGASSEGVSVVLVKEEGGAQFSVYYLSKSLSEA